MRVSAGLCFQGEKIWIFKRGPGRKNAHLWEFPGGKEESGETPADCLVRELREELSLEVSPPQIVREADCEGIHFTFLRCEALNAPRCTEHEDCTLAEPRELLQYAFCPADTPVARALALNAPALTEFFWDFDGTLMDTYPGMVACFVRAAERVGIAAEPERVLTLMKDSLGACARACAAGDEAVRLALMKGFREEEDRLPSEHIRAVPGVPEALNALTRRGGRHYLVTHRGPLAWKYLEATGLQDCFTDVVLGTDGFPRKPAPDSLLYLMKKHDLDPARCVMIGDRPLDVDAAANAGMLGCLLDEEHRFDKHPCPLHVDSADKLAETLRPMPL